jgi:hypothetical protein
MNLETKSLSEIAAIIRKEWKKVNYAAEPYLEAMHALQSTKSFFGYDCGKNVVLYFLSNASAWRGETAKAVKLELKNRTK